MTLETGRRGLVAGLTGMDVSGHNVANANTPGYTRQRVVLSASEPYTEPSLGKPEEALQLGTGVTVEQILRVRDRFLDGQIRTELHSLGNWETQKDALSEIETVFMEPSENGLNNLISQFWADWQELSRNAENSPIRSVLVQDSVTLANSINHTNSLFETIKTDQQELANIHINDVNSKARQIAALNQQIVNIKAAGDQPNDLMDKRDLLLDELAELVNYTLTENDNGSVKVDMGSENLVDGSNYITIAAIDWAANPDPWSGGPYDQVTGGNLNGIKDILAKLQTYEDDLDTLAENLITEINGVHAAGYGLDGSTGVEYFTGTGAADIAVNGDIVADPGKIAAAAISDAPGNGANALAIAGLQNSSITGLGGTSFGGYYKNMIARLGVETQESARMVDNQQALVDQLSNRKESISGVSMDEEMINIIQYQYAYMGSARVISTLDSMLDTLINRMAV